MDTDNKNTLQHKDNDNTESVQNDKDFERSLFEEQEKERLKLKELKELSELEDEKTVKKKLILQTKENQKENTRDNPFDTKKAFSLKDEFSINDKKDNIIKVDVDIKSFKERNIVPTKKKIEKEVKRDVDFTLSKEFDINTSIENIKIEKIEKRERFSEEEPYPLPSTELKEGSANTPLLIKTKEENIKSLDERDLTRNTKTKIKSKDNTLNQEQNTSLNTHPLIKTKYSYQEIKEEREINDSSTNRVPTHYIKTRDYYEQDASHDVEHQQREQFRMQVLQVQAEQYKEQEKRKEKNRNRNSIRSLQKKEEKEEDYLEIKKNEIKIKSSSISKKPMSVKRKGKNKLKIKSLDNLNVEGIEGSGDVGVKTADSINRSVYKAIMLTIRVAKKVIIKLIKAIVTAIVKVLSLLPIWIVAVILIIVILVFAFVPSTDLGGVNKDNVEMMIQENDEFFKIREFANMHKLKIENIIYNTPHDRLILPTGYGIPNLLELYLESYYLTGKDEIDESKISIDTKIEETNITEANGDIRVYKTLIIKTVVDYNPNIVESIVGDRNLLEKNIYLIAGILPEDNTPIFSNGSVEGIFWNYFLGKGYTKESIAAMMGNIYMESGFNVDAIEQTTTNPGEGAGLVQWSFGRKEALMHFAHMRGKPWTDLGLQLDYLDYELNNSQASRFYKRNLPYPYPHNHLGYNDGVKGFKTDVNLEQATTIFCFNFETPNYSMAGLKGRIAKAEEYYNMFKDGFTGKFIYPVPYYTYISSYYGHRSFLLNGSPYSDFHTGIDFPAPLGTSFVAPASGTIIFVGLEAVGGNTIKIDHGGGVISLGCHLSGFNCTVGQRVNVGEVIGYVGSTGFSSGNHLHFEVRVNGQSVDPLPMLQ